MKTGDKAPEFSLIGTDGFIHTLKDYKGFKGICLCFLSLTCEESKKSFSLLKELNLRYKQKSIAFIGIFQKEEKETFTASLEKLNRLELDFDLLLDATNDLLNKFKVKTRFHCYIFNQSKLLIYSGRILENPEKADSRNFVSLALDQLVGGLPIENPCTEVTKNLI